MISQLYTEGITVKLGVRSNNNNYSLHILLYTSGREKQEQGLHKGCPVKGNQTPRPALIYLGGGEVYTPHQPSNWLIEDYTMMVSSIVSDYMNAMYN